MATSAFFLLPEAKAYLGITDTTNDVLLQQYVDTATQAVVDALSWDPSSQTVTHLHDGTSVQRMVVNRKHITDVLDISFMRPGASFTSMDLTQIYWDDNTIYSQTYCFPCGRKNVSITYTAGYAPLPAPLLIATKMTLAAMWSGKDYDQNTTGSSVPGVESLQFRAGGPGSMPPQAMALLTRYQIPLLVS